MCVSPLLRDVNETRCTLDFGQRALKITTTAYVNVEVSLSDISVQACMCFQTPFLKKITNIKCVFCCNIGDSNYSKDLLTWWLFFIVVFGISLQVSRVENGWGFQIIWDLLLRTDPQWCMAHFVMPARSIGHLLFTQLKAWTRWKGNCLCSYLCNAISLFTDVAKFILKKKSTRRVNNNSSAWCSFVAQAYLFFHFQLTPVSFLS